jgi:hypothetical protein
MPEMQITTFESMYPHMAPDGEIRAGAHAVLRCSLTSCYELSYGALGSMHVHTYS